MYGLTEGTEKADEVTLLPLGIRATSRGPEQARARRHAVVAPQTFKAFYEEYNRNSLPSSDLFPKILTGKFDVPQDQADDCATMLRENGRFVGIIRDISGRPMVMLDAPDTEEEEAEEETGSDSVIDLSTAEDDDEAVMEEPDPSGGESLASGQSPNAAPKPIFVGHGKKKGPLTRLEKILTGFQIPFKTAVVEPNLGRPIPTKVKEVMAQCGSAILIFTKDEKLMDSGGNEVWRPSENVVHELGAASFAYEDRIVIFKEEGLSLASNYSSIGYIEFQEDSIESKTAELLQELIGFGLLKLTPAA